MKKNVFLWIIAILLLLFNLNLLYKYKQQKNNINDLTDNIVQIADDKKIEITQLKETILIQQRSEAYPCTDVEMKNPKTKENVSLHSLLKQDKPVLFFRFKENDCDACVRNATQILSDIAEHFPEIDLAILSGYGNVRQFYAYVQAENHQLNIYNVDHLPLPVDEQDVPYFFILTPELKMQNVFIPDKSDPMLTAQYLDVMQKKYWPDKHDHTHCTHDHHSH
jgi:hypothetical protein